MSMSTSGCGEAQLHHREQAVAPGDEPGLLPVVLEQATASATELARWYSKGAGTCIERPSRQVRSESVRVARPPVRAPCHGSAAR